MATAMDVGHQHAALSKTYRNAMAACKSYTAKTRLQHIVQDGLRLDRLNRLAIGEGYQPQRRESLRKRRPSYLAKPRELRTRAEKVVKATVHAITFIKPSITPYQRLQRLARAIKHVINLCRACKESVTRVVSKEGWFVLVDNVVAETEMTSHRRTGRAFVTFIPNESRELIQLSFDASEYRRDNRAETALTDDVKETLRKPSLRRTADEVITAIRCLRNLSKQFARYPLDVQKEVCTNTFYDKYQPNRVITQRGHPPGGMYFVLSGQLISQKSGDKVPTEIHADEVFGENDIIIGDLRQSTVITRTRTELLFLHTTDYKRIFGMLTKHHGNASELDICKKHPVFQHFPLQRLADNPAYWSMWHYKPGRVIEKDSNKLDWIYVIKSGEAQLLKQLETDSTDIAARRQAVRIQLTSQSEYSCQRRLLGFVIHTDKSVSSYNQEIYQPLDRQRLVKSAHSSFRSITRTTFRSLPVSPALKIDRKHAKFKNGDILQSNITIDSSNIVTENDSRIHDQSLSRFPYLMTPHPSKLSFAGDDDQSVVTRSSSRQRSSRRRTVKQKDNDDTVLPSFVLVDTLHIGQIFGLRSCLDSEEMGPSVSLVSAGCDVIKINKAMFFRFSDDAVFGLIRLKEKPYPSNEELIDRLDANTRWAEYRRDVLDESIRNRLKSCQR